MDPNIAKTYLSCMLEYYKTKNELHGVASKSNHMTVKLDPETGLYIDVSGKYVFYIPHDAPRSNGKIESLMVGVVRREEHRGNYRKRIIGIKYFGNVGPTIKQELNQTLAAATKDYKK